MFYDMLQKHWQSTCLHIAQENSSTRCTLVVQLEKELFKFYCKRWNRIIFNIVSTYDCWHCFLVFDIWASQSSEMTINFYNPTLELFCFSFTKLLLIQNFVYPTLFSSVPLALRCAGICQILWILHKDKVQSLCKFDYQKRIPSILSEAMLTLSRMAFRGDVKKHLSVPFRNAIFRGIIATERCCFAQLLKVVHSVSDRYLDEDESVLDNFCRLHIILRILSWTSLVVAQRVFPCVAVYEYWP
jgi:hypothetical protein